MMSLDILMNLFIKIVLITLLGALLRRKRIITDELQKGLGSLLLKVILPLSILASSQINASGELYFGLLQSGAIACCYYLLSFAAAAIISRQLKMSVQKQHMYVLMNVFANVGFIGLPLVKELCGEEAFLFAVIYNLAYQIFLVLLGIPLLTSDRRGSLPEKLKDPLNIASVLAVVLFMIPFRFPAVLCETCDMVGNMMVPVSMLIVGADLADSNLKEIFCEKVSYLICAFRLLIYPLLMLAALRLLGVNDNLTQTMVLLTALPIGSLNVILAKQYDCEGKFTSCTVIMSMILMIVTIPGICIVMRL